jgi:hypothetical protein
MIARRQRLIFTVVALIGAFVITRGVVAQPGFTDAFYHFNAAHRLVSGQGLTDPYLWTYIGAPDKLPAPSHLYWMPLTSLIAGLGMGLLNAPGNYAAAQWPFALLLAGTAYAGFWLGERLGGTRRHAWVAGLVTLFSGFYTRFWGAIDTFAPYALVGALCLVFMGSGVTTRGRPAIIRFALCGVMTGLAHLTRADGLLLLIVGWAVILWPGRGNADGCQPVPLKDRIVQLGVLTLAYLLTMSPWFIRNWTLVGAPMPLGGTQAIWFTEYNDLFNYPPLSSPTTFFANGFGALFSTRAEALFGGQGILSGNLGTFIAVEGLIVMTPLMLIGLWLRRRDAFLRGFWLYALGVHLAMTFVFPYPGYRGGLLHSGAALIPWWAVLGVIGLDALMEWIAKRRRRWNANTAKAVYSAALVGVAILLSVLIGLPNRVPARPTPALYQALAALIPAEGRVMINDPAQLYYYTGLGGVVLPNEPPTVIPVIARQYNVGYLVLEFETVDGQTALAASDKLASILTAPPAFLTELPLAYPGAKLYEIRP